MALRDYICCSECECKIVYDGCGYARDRLEHVWGDTQANHWTVDLLCPDCLKTLRARVAQLEAENAQLRAEWGEPVAFYTSQGNWPRIVLAADGNADGYEVPLYAKKEIK